METTIGDDHAAGGMHPAARAVIWDSERDPELASKEFAYLDAGYTDAPDGREPPFWRAFHWGLYAEPHLAAQPAGDPNAYRVAGEAMTDAVVAAAGITDGARVLDVGCGFGGTLDHIAQRHRCALAGLNIDGRQLRRARHLLGSFGRGPGIGSVPLVLGDGCRLPVANGSLDHVLAIECLFHFPSRKAFFREVTRVLRPGGTLALSDFVAVHGALVEIIERMARGGLGDESWYGHQSKPPTSATYERLGRMAGMDQIVDDDVTEATLPTYAALRHIYEVSGSPEGVASVASLEDLTRAGLLGYHVIAYRKRSA
jgi:SAM-dependent methyltransferase